jgi:hypothetical protein
MPWGIVSLVDLYTGFILFSIWIVYREQSWWRSLVWVVLMMTLGFSPGVCTSSSPCKRAVATGRKFGWETGLTARRSHVDRYDHGRAYTTQRCEKGPRSHEI